ncbi:MAG: amidohydrolase family protein, partial [Pseudomonadota bacterium]
MLTAAYRRACRIADAVVEWNTVPMSRLQPIIDAHHHIWSPRGTTHPWLMPDAAIPFRYGDYSEIKSDYLPSDYDADSSDFEVVGHVTMEAEWNPDDPVAETAWTATAFEGRSDYLGHVARAFLAKDDIENVLAAHAAYPIVRGIRQKPTTQPRPSSARDAVTFGVAGGMTDPQWQRGYAMLQSHGLHFELQTPWWHIDELIALHARFPETPIVINHMFMPGDRAPETVAHWGRAIRRAAELTATTIKISGMGLPGVAWRLSDH